MRSIYGHVESSIRTSEKPFLMTIARLLYNSIVINSALVEKIVTLSDKNELWDSILTNFEMTMKNEAIVQGTTLQAYRSVVKNYDFLKEWSKKQEFQNRNFFRPDIRKLQWKNCIIKQKPIGVF